jgi:hypothetical protein
MMIHEICGVPGMATAGSGMRWPHAEHTTVAMRTDNARIRM